MVATPGLRRRINTSGSQYPNIVSILSCRLPEARGIFRNSAAFGFISLMIVGVLHATSASASRAVTSGASRGK
jgi:hypothetical protein